MGDLVLDPFLLLASGVHVACTLILLWPASSLCSSMDASLSLLLLQSQHPHSASWLNFLLLLPGRAVVAYYGFLLLLLVFSCPHLLTSVLALSPLLALIIETCMTCLF